VTGAGLLQACGADPSAVPVRVHGRGLGRPGNDGGITEAVAVPAVGRRNREDGSPPERSNDP
jgi:hypothetical protein